MDAWPRRARWRAAALAVGVVGAPFALSAPAQAAERFDLAVDEATLADALIALSRATNTPILLSDDARGAPWTPRALEGRYTVEEGLDQLLPGAGFTHRVVAGAVLVELAPSPAEPVAPRAPRPRAADPEPPAPDVILVTAQRRKEDVRDAPLALSVYNTQALRAANVIDVQDVARLTPGVLGSTFTNARPILAIRGGANTLDAVGTSEPAGVYLDEVYVPRYSAIPGALVDVEQVEVLRGPQGTLFGRNVAAGAVIATTRRPELGERFGEAMLGVGERGALEAESVVNAPLGPAAAGRLAIRYEESDGYGRDVLADTEQDDLQVLAGRASLRLQPRDGLTLDLALDASDEANGARTLSATTFGDGDRRTSELGVDQFFERDTYGATGRLTAKAGRGEVIAVIGARGAESLERFSFTGLSFTRLPSGFQRVDTDRDRPRSTSQEIRYVSDADGRLRYVAGLYAFQEDSERVVETQRLAAGDGDVILDQVFDQGVKTQAYAAYVDGTYDLSPRWRVGLGARYTFEDRDARLAFTDALNPDASFAAQGLSANFDAVTPRATVSFIPNDDLTLYASASRGFTAGGFNTEADTLAEIAEPFDEETITALELGVKARLGDGRGYVHAAAFHQSYEDKQEFVFDPTTFFGSIRNAAEATIQGVEVEAAWRVNDAWRVSGSYGYLDTEYDRFPIGDGPGNTGNELGSSPRHQLSARADGAWPIAKGRGKAFAGLGATWTDDYFTGATNDPDLFIESYGLVDARVGARTADGRVEAEVYATNLLDEEYVLIPSDFVVTAEHLGPPRHIGARVRLRF